MNTLDDLVWYQVCQNEYKKWLAEAALQRRNLGYVSTRVQWAVKDAKDAMIRARAEVTTDAEQAAPSTPAGYPLPCDVTISGVTFCKGGCSLQSIIDTMNKLLRERDDGR